MGRGGGQSLPADLTRPGRLVRRLHAMSGWQPVSHCRADLTCRRRDRARRSGEAGGWCQPPV